MPYVTAGEISGLNRSGTVQVDSAVRIGMSQIVLLQLLFCFQRLAWMSFRSTALSLCSPVSEPSHDFQFILPAGGLIVSYRPFSLLQVMTFALLPISTSLFAISHSFDLPWTACRRAGFNDCRSNWSVTFLRPKRLIITRQLSEFLLNFVGCAGYWNRGRKKKWIGYNIPTLSETSDSTDNSTLYNNP
jgi:hypothetical protein